MRLGENVVEPLADEPLAVGLATSAGTAFDGEPRAAYDGEYSFVLKLPIGAGDRVRVDRQFLGQLTDAGHHLAGRERAIGDGKFHLPDDLIVNGQTVMSVDMQKHDERRDWREVVCTTVIVQ